MLVNCHIWSCIYSFFEHACRGSQKHPEYSNFNSFNLDMMRNIKIIPVILKSIRICKFINVSYLFN